MQSAIAFVERNVVHTSANLLACGFLSKSFKTGSSWSAEVIWPFHWSCSCQDNYGSLFLMHVQ